VYAVHAGRTVNLVRRPHERGPPVHDTEQNFCRAQKAAAAGPRREKSEEEVCENVAVLPVFNPTDPLHDNGPPFQFFMCSTMKLAAFAQSAGCASILQKPVETSLDVEASPTSLRTASCSAALPSPNDLPFRFLE